MKAPPSATLDPCLAARPWAQAVPMTLVIFYFLYKINGYFWRIYNRFKLPADNVVTGAFNLAGSDDSHYQSEVQRQEEQARQAAEMAELHAKYAHLPESVKSSMGISSSGAPGPSHAY